jgi:hypothetical protein
MALGLSLTWIMIPAAHAQPGASEILDEMKQRDERLQEGLRASGVCYSIQSYPDLPPVKKTWRYSLSKSGSVYEEEVVEILAWDHPVVIELGIAADAQRTDPRGRTPFLVIRRLFLLNARGQFQYDFVGRAPQPGSLPAGGPREAGSATAGSLGIDEPDEPTYKLDFERAGWLLGRGFADRLTTITSIRLNEDGTILIGAEGTMAGGGSHVTWELTIDSASDYLVREAKMFRGDKTSPAIHIVNSGSRRLDSVSYPTVSRHRDNLVAGRTRAMRFEIEQFSRSSDRAFLDAAARTMRAPYVLHTDVMDMRSSPTLNSQYNAGSRLSQKQESFLRRTWRKLWGR